jgi:hypothetical protein
MVKKLYGLSYELKLKDESNVNNIDLEDFGRMYYQFIDDKKREMMVKIRKLYVNPEYIFEIKIYDELEKLYRELGGTDIHIVGSLRHYLCELGKNNQLNYDSNRYSILQMSVLRAEF